jgi:HlyD family secretion protein
MISDSTSHESQGGALRQVLDAQPAGRFSDRRLWGALALVAIVALVAFLLLRSKSSGDQPVYRTEPATIGTLAVKVSATGNLQPTNAVDVGSELSGTVEKVFVDDNDRVKKGQVLAHLDLSKLEDTVAKSRANLASAESQVLRARATVAEARANLERFKQVSELSGGKVPSRSEMSTAEANVLRAQADETAAQASVAQAKATLRSDATNLDKASIRSPIDGVVLTRVVEPGQTVAASFQAPVLFKLAEDLAKMELQVDVDEADVGQVKVGQHATFTVDAWPGREYSAVITRVGFGSQEKEGVISYRTLLNVDNSDLSLRPGMTGTAEIATVTRDNALLVPNAALRFAPPAAAAASKKSGPSIVSTLMPRAPRQAPKEVTVKRKGQQARVWVLQDGKPVAVEVRTGATDGKVTEITGGPLKAGTEVITEAETRAK